MDNILLDIANSFLDKLDEYVILESKLDDLLDSKNIPEEDKKRIIELNDRLTNKTKYVNYLVKYYNEHDIVELINEFDKRYHTLDNKDINQYKIDNLREILRLSSNYKSKSELKSSGALK